MAQESSVRRLQHSCDPALAGSEQEEQWGDVASGMHRRITEKELVQELERNSRGYSRAQTMVVSSDSSLRRLTPQWSRRVLAEGCSTPATPRLQGANRRSSGDTLRQGRIGASPRNVGWSRAWTMRTGEPSRTQALSALTKKKKVPHPSAQLLAALLRRPWRVRRTSRR